MICTLFQARRFLGRLSRICLVSLPLGTIGPNIGSGEITTPARATEAVPQPGYASAEDAVNALIGALRTNNISALRHILGPGSNKLIASGDSVADANTRKSFLAEYDEAHTLKPDGNGRMALVIGQNGWQSPIPIVQENDTWYFDTESGVQEVVNRRIGRNELLTIRTLLSVVEAEKDYFDRVKRGTGTGVYAQRFFSTEQAQDGLYWEVAEGEASSPLGPLVDQAKSEGYPGAVAPDGKPVPYNGYLFRFLTSQGPEATGGPKDYIKDGAMTGGFALIARPAIFGTSGIMTFLVNQDGVVYQKDLGEDTAKAAAEITSFNPGPTWTQVSVSN